MPTNPSTSSATTAARAVDGSAEAEWTRWPASESPSQTAMLAASIVAAGLLAGFVVESVACGLMAAGLLTLSVANFLLPIRYALTGDGVRVKGLGEVNLIKWSRIDTARLRDDHAVLLVTPDGVSAAREFTLYYPPDAKKVADSLRQRLLDAGAPLV